MKKELEGSITISRPTCGNGDEYISINIKDKASRTEFLEVKISYEDFTLAITGLSGVGCKILPRKLNTIGKKRITSVVTARMPKDTEWGSRHQVAFEKCVEVIKPSTLNWEVSRNFGSKDSFFYEDGEEYCKTTITRYKEIVDEEN